ncbi:hypothetical protein TSAR_004820, partial [Trichomalopsis sarcophagae]
MSTRDGKKRTMREEEAAEQTKRRRRRKRNERAYTELKLAEYRLESRAV